MPHSTVAALATAAPLTDTAKPRRRWPWLDAALVCWLGVAARSAS